MKTKRASASLPKKKARATSSPPPKAPSQKKPASASQGTRNGRGISRATVARMLRCHITTVRRYEKRGRLHPITDAQGWKRFDPLEVKMLAAEIVVPTSPSTKKPLQALREARKPLEVRVELSPDTLKALAEQIAELLRAVLGPKVAPRRKRTRT